MQADLLPDKVYDVALDPKGFWVYRIQMSAIGRNDPRRSELSAWEAGETMVALRDDDTTREFQADMKTKVDEVLKDFIGGAKAERVRTLAQGDHR